MNLKIIAFFLTIGFYLACDSSRVAVADEKFTLGHGETARIINSNLFVKIVGTGAQENDSGALDYFCLLEVSLDDQKERHDIPKSGSIVFKNFTVKVENVAIRKSCELSVSKISK